MIFDNRNVIFSFIYVAVYARYTIYVSASHCCIGNKYSAAGAAEYLQNLY